MDTGFPATTEFRFCIAGLDAAQFRPLFDLSDAELAARNIVRTIADEADGYPCRVRVDHAPVGDELLLLNFEHQPARTPYRASGPIYVCKSAVSTHFSPNTITDAIAQRLISFRAYDTNHLMIDAEVAEGTQAGVTIERLFADARARYVHLHYARRGCFACRVDRF